MVYMIAAFLGLFKLNMWPHTWFALEIFYTPPVLGQDVPYMSVKLC